MNFRYRAYLADGRPVAGDVDAADRQDALRQLATQGKSVFELVEKTSKEVKPKSGRKTSRSFTFLQSRFDAAQLFSDLALLTEAGLNITQALRSVASTEVTVEQRKVVSELLASMSTGTSAAVAFGAIKSIPADSLGLVASGESAGRLPEVFRALATQYDERAKLRSQLLNALGYPLFLFVLMILAILVLIFLLVPAIEPIFQNADRAPPIIVSILSGLRRWLTGGFIFAGPIAVITLLVAYLLPAPRARLSNSMSRLVVRLPFIGTVIQKTALSRYLSSLSLLLSNGTSMSKALALAATSVSSVNLRARLLAIRDRVATGERLPAALESCHLFDERIISLISVGDEANRLAVVTKRAANILDSEAQATTNRFIAVLTPAMTITLGLLVGGLVVSVMTALLSINEIVIQ